MTANSAKKCNFATCFISHFPMNKSVSTTVSYRRIWQIAYPILLSVLMEQLINLTDTAFLGRVGQVELGASALSGIFYISVFVIGLGFGQGAQILMARRNGERCYSRISGIFYHSLAFLLFLALVLCIFTSLLGPQVLRSIISNPEVAEAANNYLQWRVYGMFMAYVAILFRSFYVATVNTRMLTLNSLMMVGTNVVFDYVLIFGYGPVPALGISGAAIASVIAETVSMLFFIIYTRARVDYRKYGFHRMPRARLSLFSHILGISVWTMMQDFLSLATWFIFFLAVEHLGAAELAASNIIRNISSVTYMSVSALSATAMTLVSNMMGEGRVEGVLPMLRRTVVLGYLVLVPVCLLIAAMPDAVFSIFTNETYLAEIGRGPLYVLLGCYVLTIPAQIYFRAVSGTGDTRMALIIETGTLFFYLAFVYVAIFRMQLSLAVSWCSEYVYQGMVLLMCLAYFRYSSWQTRRI